MQEQLRKLQLMQLEILKVIDVICKKYQIKYSLYAGTLLGAVRHKGFIPWDDDLDICMARSEYDKFIEVWNIEKPEGYFLQNKENEPNFTQSFTKIRKNHTTFLQNEEEKGKYHTGIFVDVFPIDRIPDGKAKRVFFKWHCMLYQLYTREFIPPQSGRITKFVTAVLLKLVTKEKRPTLRKKYLRSITKYNENTKFHTAAIETMASLQIRFPQGMLDAYTTIQFEDAQFMCFACWDEHLKCKFGDYMQLPPESERTWKHHPLMIDFERNFEEIEC